MTFAQAIDNLLRAFWRSIALFAYRRWARPDGRIPDGVPGIRDPDSRCAMYAPRKPRLGDYQDCLTDGHYLCRGCCHRDPSLDDQEVATP